MTQENSERLYRTCYMRVFSFAMTLTGNREQAEEITQETFFRASRHEAIPEELPFDGESPEETAADRDSSFRIHLALHALEEPYREVFELRVFGELSFREIGMIFSKTENWARVTYHRARLKLQERMNKE